MRLIFAGTPHVALPSLEALLASDHEVVAVLTRPDAPLGRKRVLTPSPVKVRAEAAGIPVLEADRLRGDVLTEIEALAPDAVAVVAYGALAGPRALAAATHGWFNLHFSLLPAWRGAAPVQRAIMAGQTDSGVTVFRLDTGMDTGDIVARTAFELPETDAGTVLDDYAERGAPVLVAALDAVAAGTADFRPQAGQSSHADKITPDEARLDFRAPAPEVSARARGVTPQPGAWALIDGKRTKLYGIRTAAGAPSETPSGTPTDLPADLPTDLPPGRLTRHGEAVLIGTGEGAVTVSGIQPFGKPRMSALDFHRGRGDIDFDLEETP